MSETRTVAVLGASSGIGAALARALIDDGHRLFVGARRIERLAQLTDNGRSAAHAAVDVSDEMQVRAFFERVAVAFGNLDALVICSGSYGPIGAFHKTAPEEWWSAVRANLFGTCAAVRYAVPLMRAERRPRIITFSGGGAFSPLPRYSAYAVSKAGIVRFTETIAEELAPLGITVNGVAPGFVRSEIHDATLAAGPEAAGPEFYEMTRRKLEDGAVPVEVPVACVRFLLSPRADGLTGKTISATFDPWREPDFANSISAINASDLYTMQRINLVHLGGGSLKQVLARADSGNR